MSYSGSWGHLGSWKEGWREDGRKDGRREGERDDGGRRRVRGAPAPRSL